jgi:hypothetical protein
LPANWIVFTHGCVTPRWQALHAMFPTDHKVR